MPVYVAPSYQTSQHPDVAFTGTGNDSAMATVDRRDDESSSSPMTTMARTPPAFPPEDRFEYVLMHVVLPVVIAVGTFGNVMSFVVLLRPRMRHTSVYFYLKVLACADTAVLYVSGFKTWIRLQTGYELMHASDFACKTVMFLLVFALHLSAWTVVLMTFDRFVAVWFPFRATILCSFARARLATGVLTLLLVGYNLHFFWTHLLWQPTNRPLPVCGPAHDDRFMRGPYEWIKLTTYTFVPFIAIFGLNVAIIVRLRWTSPQLRRSYGGGGSGGGVGGRRSSLESTAMMTGSTSATATATAGETSTMGRQSRVTYMLLSVTLTWLLLTAPFALHSLVRFRQFRAVAFLLMYCNHSINFYMYCVSGRNFRKELRGLLVAVCRCRCRRVRNWPWRRETTNRKSMLSMYPSIARTQRTTHLVDVELHEILADVVAGV